LDEGVLLLLDDDDTFRTALAEHLRDDGHLVWDSAAPLTLPPPDKLDEVELVVTDYHMPGETGLQFADRLHQVHPRVPVVILTAETTAHLENAVAVRDHLVLCHKPVEYEALHRLILDLIAAPPAFTPTA
jgi:two-component system nitrogen regulation response regulator GlnG